MKDKIQCMICGQWFTQVGSHVVQKHNMTARQYRIKFGFDVKKGQLPESFRKHKARMAIEKGGVKNLIKGAKYRFKKGDTIIYKRSRQTLTRLKTPILKGNRVLRNMNKLNLDLSGIDGNAFSLLAYFKKEAKEAGWTDSSIKEIINKAQQGDYDHLIRTLMSV